jgi:hypothetical protein
MGSPEIGMAMGTRDLQPGGFSPIRRRVWVEFCIYGSVGGADVVSSRFASPCLILLNPDLVPVVPGPKLNK